MQSERQPCTIFRMDRYEIIWTPAGIHLDNNMRPLQKEHRSRVCEISSDDSGEVMTAEIEHCRHASELWVGAGDDLREVTLQISEVETMAII